MQELRDIHTDLTEEDIATLATARLAEEQPRDRMWYRINAVKVLGGKSKLQPTVNARLATVQHFTLPSLIELLHLLYFSTVIFLSYSDFHSCIGTSFDLYFFIMFICLVRLIPPYFWKHVVKTVIHTFNLVLSFLELSRNRIATFRINLSINVLMAVK